MPVDYQKLERIRKRNQNAKQSDRFQNIVCFLHAKGLLTLAKKPKTIRDMKIDIKDILWAAKYEPRILEVFPAAYLHFPRKFRHIDKAPKLLNAIIHQLKLGAESGNNFRGIKYQDMKRWCDIQLKDKRTTPLAQQKVLRSFMLSPLLDQKLDTLAQERGITKTAILEQAIEAIF